MKRIRSERANRVVKHAACTVSAAALMLGVSQAATVGFNFQTHYCAAASYSGAVVTGPAFGIDTNGWESLAQMDTGYSCPAPADYYTLTNTIDTTSSGSGLNPLPSGSLTVTWSGYTANVSGFGGYTRSGPHYTFGGNGYKPGNEQVYWGFIRDGVNFGPGSSGGDNSQPGYSIDITGLKSVFTNSFAVQLIASADSMQYLTNAFIIDATANSTQSVVYPSTPPVADVGDTAWVRGIGGGLSTASGSLSTDHLKIIGNRAAHAGNKTNGYNFASTIAGFIITDKPVITMEPQQVVVSPGDTITWSGYACGATPLTYQWRKNGAPIAGANSSSYTITGVTGADFATFDLMVSNAYGIAISSPVSVDRLSAVSGNNYTIGSNTAGPTQDALVFGATWAGTNSDSGGITRTGVMSFNATNSNQIVISGSTNFDGATGTLMFWMRSSGVSNPTGKPATLFDRLNGNGMVVFQNTDGTLELKTSQSAQDLTTGNLSDDKWHQIAVTYDQSASGQVIVYVDGQLVTSGGNTAAWSWQAGQEIELGLSHDTNSWQAFNGSLDEVRMYNRVLSQAEITSAFGGALVDNNALTLRLSFDSAPVAGVTFKWASPDAILQSADSPAGPFTDVPGAVSPWPTATALLPVGGRSPIKFYRYRGHVPTNIVSNPFLM